MTTTASMIQNVEVSVMSFNTWNSGNNVDQGLLKIARHIEINNPDIVGLQEMYDDKIDELLQLLENRYRKCSQQFGSDYTITRLPIVEEYAPSTELMNTGCKIELSSDPFVTINLWNVHLHWTTYGPYSARDNQPNNVDPSVLFDCECKNHDTAQSRLHNLKHLLNHQPFKDCLRDIDKSPLILLGDFNCPSHLDWVEKCKCNHYGWHFDWPVSKLLEDAGFKDSFREVHEDPSSIPGITWSPVVKSGDNKEEPQDRIDFIYFAGSIIPTQSEIYHGFPDGRNFDYPNHFQNDWPSDHSAVITNFLL